MKLNYKRKENFQFHLRIIIFINQNACYNTDLYVCFKCFIICFLYLIFINRIQFKCIHQLYSVVSTEQRQLFDLFELNKFVNFCQRYDPPSMCSKHVNGFPAAHDHIANGNVTKMSYAEHRVYAVFVTFSFFGDFVFVNSSNTHHYKTQISHVLRFSFLVLVNEKPNHKKLYVFCMFFYLFVFLSLFCSLQMPAFRNTIITR